MNHEKERLIVEQMEIDLLLEGLFRRYGHDLRDYARAHMTRQLRHALDTEPFDDFGAYQHALLQDETVFRRLLDLLVVPVTEMFRDPAFYKKLRVLLREVPTRGRERKIWIAGCSTGEEAYALAILLAEEGLLADTVLYATDYSERLLGIAREGIYPLEKIKHYARNYHAAGGTRSFSGYFTLRYDHVMFNRELKDHIVFDTHNLVSDGTLGEMSAIFCRNVMIYFNGTLRDRVVGLFSESLQEEGVLGLGTKESLRLSGMADRFETIDESLSLYRLKGEER
jgi:chemotaxis protein methyltransferase CheR